MFLLMKQAVHSFAEANNNVPETLTRTHWHNIKNHIWIQTISMVLKKLRSICGPPSAHLMDGVLSTNNFK